MKSAEELRAITEGRTKAQQQQRAQIRQENADRAEAQIDYYFERMRKTLTEKGEEAAAKGIGLVSVHNLAGEYIADESLDGAQSFGRPVAEGTEEAWRRFQSDLAPL